MLTHGLQMIITSPLFRQKGTPTSEASASLLFLLLVELNETKVQVLLAKKLWKSWNLKLLLMPNEKEMEQSKRQGKKHCQLIMKWQHILLEHYDFCNFFKKNQPNFPSFFQKLLETSMSEISSSLEDACTLRRKRNMKIACAQTGNLFIHLNCS